MYAAHPPLQTEKYIYPIYSIYSVASLNSPSMAYCCFYLFIYFNFQSLFICLSLFSLSRTSFPLFWSIGQPSFVNVRCRCASVRHVLPSVFQVCFQVILNFCRYSPAISLFWFDCVLSLLEYSLCLIQPCHLSKAFLCYLFSKVIFVFAILLFYVFFFSHDGYTLQSS